jgi:hypothetical protein
MSNPQDFSFEEEGAAAAAPDTLKRLNETLAEAIELKQAVDQLEDDLAAAKKNLNYLNTSVLPDMMAEIGMEECTQNGWKVKVGEFVSGSLPKDEERKNAAIAWLEGNEAGDLLKTSLSVVFSRSQHNEALALASDIEQQGFAINVESNVHPQTLQAFARERLKNGEALDTEVLGLYTGRVAKFKRVGEG